MKSMSMLYVCLCIIYKLNHGTIYSFQDTQWMLIALGLIPLILTGLHRHELAQRLGIKKITNKKHERKSNRTLTSHPNKEVKFE